MSVGKAIGAALAAAALACLGLGAPAFAQTGVTTLAALGANDSVSWSQEGPPGTPLKVPFTAASANGLTVTVNPDTATTSIGAYYEVAEEGIEWNGTFALGSILLTTDRLLILTFSQPVEGVGALAQDGSAGDFTATIVDSNGFTFTTTGDNERGDSNTAPFVGVLDSTNDITSITFTTFGTAAAGSPGLAIGTLELYEAPAGTAVVPEAGSLVNMGGALLALCLAGGLGLAARRRRAARLE